MTDILGIDKLKVVNATVWQCLLGRTGNLNSLCAQVINATNDNVGSHQCHVRIFLMNNKQIRWIN